MSTRSKLSASCCCCCGARPVVVRIVLFSGSLSSLAYRPSTSVNHMAYHNSDKTSRHSIRRQRRKPHKYEELVQFVIVWFVTQSFPCRGFGSLVRRAEIAAARCVAPWVSSAMAADRHRNFMVVERRPLLMISPFAGAAPVDIPAQNPSMTPANDKTHTSEYTTTKDSLQVGFRYTISTFWHCQPRLSTSS